MRRGAVAARVLVLASSSPRRAALLASLGLAFTQQPSGRPEETTPGPPAEVARRLARGKAEAVAAFLPEGWVLGADTLVWHRGEALGQPRDAAEALAMLERLQGSEHDVVTGLCVTRAPRGPAWEDAVRTRVRFAPIPRAALEAYVATGEPLGKAGAYAIQGIAAAYIASIDGPWDNVVGLPLRATLALLARAGYPLPAHLAGVPGGQA